MIAGSFLIIVTPILTILRLSGYAIRTDGKYPCLKDPFPSRKVGVSICLCMNTSARIAASRSPSAGPSKSETPPWSARIVQARGSFAGSLPLPHSVAGKGMRSAV